MRIVVVNIGSATVKAALVEAGQESARVLAARSLRRPPDSAGLEDAVGSVLSALVEERGGASIEAMAHRMVHGGARFMEPQRIDDELVRALEERVGLAPLHNEATLAGIRIARERFPELPMVVVFDTHFHAQRQEVSTRYALPWELSDTLGIRRFGFHGFAHASLIESLAQAEGTPPSAVHAVTLQLGAGCSAAAIEGGRSIETSMGFTPLEGLMMATRSGDVDPAVVLHLLREGQSPDEVDRILSTGSGLQGLAGSSDMRQVLRAETAGDARASLAVSLFARRIVTTVGAYFTLLEGRGSLVFGGGIGTHSAPIRERVAAGLRAWNVELDPERNEDGAPGRVSAPGSRPVYVFETDEETLIASACARTIEAS